MAAKKKKKTKLAPPKKKKKIAAKKKVAPKKKKVAPKKKAAPKKKPKKVAKKKAIRRSDGHGHLDPKYKKDLLAESGGDPGLKDAKRGAFKVKDDSYAEDLGQEVVGEATSGEDEKEDLENRIGEEERGGPFVVTTGQQEFGYEPDESNPIDGDVEPFPKT